MLIKHLVLKKLELEVYLYNINMPKKKITPREYADAAAGVRLSAHEKLCAERMKLIHDSIKDLQKEVKSLRNEVSTGKGIVKVLVFLGTIAATIIGIFQFK